MQFELTSFILGLVAGGVIAFILKLQALRKLTLDLKTLGLSLGVEGFEGQAKEIAAPPIQPVAGVKIEGGVSGKTGDIAGGNIDKSVRNVAGGNVDRSSHYAPQLTLKQGMTNLSEQIADLGKVVTGKFEHQSRVYDYHFKGDLDRIHQDVLPLVDAGWLITSTVMLPDYEGRTRLWLLLARPISAEKRASIDLHATRG